MQLIQTLKSVIKYANKSFSVSHIPSVNQTIKCINNQQIRCNFVMYLYSNFFTDSKGIQLEEEIVYL